MKRSGMTSDIFRNLRGVAPDELIEFLALVVSFFPEEFRVRLRQVVDSLPATGDSMEKALEFIQTFGERDWQPGLPSVIVAITDSDHAFAERVWALPMARWHALFFGYRPEQQVRKSGL